MHDEQVKEIIADRLRVDIYEVSQVSHSLKEDIGASDLDMMELVMVLEDKFNLKISDYDAQRFKRVQDVIDFVNNHVQG